ncbi:DUF4240 domain-containing protein [Planotetraspora sp. A-T 1434]|uniref:DUF4240 domain-containing protein n=1 Tax=Planotetraspora sp. A-T 1434 TaxID=2979219 RepID=UPI0021C0B84B|nr:DUF4240 domain-containing protein [Planotetraspora sp. A-T 1434]MCT9933450.1 DUF4240 domain-containing protein [Planotetraspora sp. A-T 1434]
MDADEFWALIDGSARQVAGRNEHAGLDERGGPDLRAALDERAEWLTEALSRRSPEEIIGFQIRRAEVKKAADTWPMWGAAYLIADGWCSEDVFWYFQSWLISLGRETFERVTAEPDLLADVPAVLRQLDGEDDEWEEPQWEVLDYVAERAYERVTGEEDGLANALWRRGIDLAVNPEPPDDGLPGGQAERAGRLPRLSRLFPNQQLASPTPIVEK